MCLTQQDRNKSQLIILKLGTQYWVCLPSFSPDQNPDFVKYTLNLKTVSWGLLGPRITWMAYIFVIG